MLPVATPPNAIVYGSEKVPMVAMMRAGFWLNLIELLIASAWVTLLVKFIV